MTRFSERAVRVRAPATSANLGPGFDSLGLALTLYDEVEAGVTPGGVDVSVEGVGSGAVSCGEDNLVVRTVRATFDHLGVRQPGLALRCLSRIPHGRGLGSSAAAIVAGVLIARKLTDDTGMSDADVFAFAADLEGHPDNVAACLSGGVTIAWRSEHDQTGHTDQTVQAEGDHRWLRLEPDPTLVPVVLVPEQTLSTQQARGLLPESVPHRDAAANVSRAALLVAALTGHPELLFEATGDRLHQRYRATAIPHSAELVAKLRAAGVAAVISGAGPTVLALSRENLADSIGSDVSTDWHVHRLSVDREGARAQMDVPATRTRD